MRLFIFKLMFSVYILHSPSFNKIYIGFTSNLEARLLSHNSLGTKGYTIKYRPWSLLHTEAFATKAEAMQRENELKSGKGREWIHKILSQR